jgi:hypothetical protein
MNQKIQVFKINGDSRNRKSEVVGGKDWCGKKKRVWKSDSSLQEVKQQAFEMKITRFSHKIHSNYFKILLRNRYFQRNSEDD